MVRNLLDHWILWEGLCSPYARKQHGKQSNCHTGERQYAHFLIVCQYVSGRWARHSAVAFSPKTHTHIGPGARQRSPTKTTTKQQERGTTADAAARKRNKKLPKRSKHQDIDPPSEQKCSSRLTTLTMYVRRSTFSSVPPTWTWRPRAPLALQSFVSRWATSISAGSEWPCSCPYRMHMYKRG